MGLTKFGPETLPTGHRRVHEKPENSKNNYIRLFITVQQFVDTIYVSTRHVNISGTRVSQNQCGI